MVGAVSGVQVFRSMLCKIGPPDGKLGIASGFRAWSLLRLRAEAGDQRSGRLWSGLRNEGLYGFSLLLNREGFKCDWDSCAVHAELLSTVAYCGLGIEVGSQRAKPHDLTIFVEYLRAWTMEGCLLCIRCRETSIRCHRAQPSMQNAKASGGRVHFMSSSPNTKERIAEVGYFDANSCFYAVACTIRLWWILLDGDRPTQIRGWHVAHLSRDPHSSCGSMLGPVSMGTAEAVQGTIRERL
jgi:hypothetical protein